MLWSPGTSTGTWPRTTTWPTLPARPYTPASGASPQTANSSPGHPLDEHPYRMSDGVGQTIVKFELPSPYHRIYNCLRCSVQDTQFHQWIHRQYQSVCLLLICQLINPVYYLLLFYQCLKVSNIVVDHYFCIFQNLVFGWSDKSDVTIEILSD